MAIGLSVGSGNLAEATGATVNNDLRLRGRRILIVEDEYAIAMDLADSLAEHGMDVIGPAADLDSAFELIGAQPRIDIALLDVVLERQPVFSLADALQQRGVPFVFSTGYGPDDIPQRFSEAHRCQKPFDLKSLLAAIRAELKAH